MKSVSISRRQFVEAAVLAGLLPWRALADDTSVSGAEVPPDEVFKRMKLTRRTLRIGVKNPFSVLHVSDTHLVRVSAVDLAALDAKSAAWYESRQKTFAGGIFGLAAAVSYAKKESLPLFHTGDLIDFASRANWSGIGPDFDGVDWFYSCGNHEYRGWRGAPALVQGDSKAERETARKAFEAFVPNAIPVASRVIGGVNFVQYDNGGFSDYLARQQFAAIRREFEKGLPVVLLCHMPFWSEPLCEAILKANPGMTRNRINTGFVQGRPDKQNWDGRLEMTEWLRKQALLKAVLCGHLHQDFTDDFSPTARQYVADANYRGAVYRYDFI